MEFELTVERRRAGEAVLRDGAGRRFVLPAEFVPGERATVSLAPRAPEPANPKGAGRAFLTELLSRA